MRASLIYLIDNTLDGQGASPRELRAVLSRVAEGTEILTEPYHAVSLKRVKSLNPSHIVLSGQSHPWDRYAPESLAGVIEVIKQAPQPTLGVCGGHQQIALAYGATVDLMARLEPGEGYEGAKRERGYFPVETSGESIFQNLPREITVWHSHFDEVKSLPQGFRRTAWNENCPIQAMEHTDRPLFGVQFHPELFDDAHPEGRKVIENFLKT
ncbi:MAG TPA: gamma-glutamyl-gamma-aminobutyrate hydrolase family protein [Pyrinomonadaceae bacterium]|jgi:GMP synthase (glutamine-hydrolysing)|nr:gamma-glutamyl-gamma-aminobutyrate hydrolase family protein [Pyrinomonadaceae bacterium]